MNFKYLFLKQLSSQTGQFIQLWNFSRLKEPSSMTKSSSSISNSSIGLQKVLKLSSFLFSSSSSKKFFSRITVSSSSDSKETSSTINSGSSSFEDSSGSSFE